MTILKETPTQQFTKKQQEMSTPMSIDEEYEYENEDVLNELISSIIDNVFEYEKENKNVMCEALEQSANAQDFVKTGRYYDIENSNGHFDWMVIADGHGRPLDGWGEVIDIFRAIPWSKVIHNKTVDDFNECILGYLDGVNTNQNGSTLSIVKIFGDYIECFWIGDSQIRVYENNKSVFESVNHNAENENEMKRMRDMEKDGTLSIRNTDDIKVLSSSIITMADNISKYFDFDFWNKINMTRSFGHNNVTKLFMEYERIDRNPYAKYKVMAATDGFWDMTGKFDNLINSSEYTNAKFLSKIAKGRWEQKWTYIPKGMTLNDAYKTQFARNTSAIDDIGIATWIQDYEPIPPPQPTIECHKLCIEIPPYDNCDYELYN